MALIAAPNSPAVAATFPPTTPLLPRRGCGGATASHVRAGTSSTFDEQLTTRLDRALTGDVEPLYQLLANHGGLPGVRANARTVDAFARACAARGGAASERLVLTMVQLDIKQAPGASDREVLPVCAVAALGARAVSDPTVAPRVLAELLTRADDLRFRVREAVPEALVRMGGAMGDALLVELDGWMGGLFSAAAVVSALGVPQWLDAVKNHEAAIARLDEAWTLANEAPRSSHRYPGYKALLDALSTSPGLVAGRFRTPVFDAMVHWAAGCEPPMRDVLAANLRGQKMAGKLAQEAERVRRALAASAPAPRDPTEKVQHTRGRGARRH